MQSMSLNTDVTITSSSSVTATIKRHDQTTATATE